MFRFVSNVVFIHHRARSTSSWVTRKLHFLRPHEFVAFSASQWLGRCQNSKNVRVLKRGRLLKMYSEKERKRCLTQCNLCDFFLFLLRTDLCVHLLTIRSYNGLRISSVVWGSRHHRATCDGGEFTWLCINIQGLKRARCGQNSSKRTL